jgi:hypothetical protein
MAWASKGSNNGSSAGSGGKISIIIAGHDAPQSVKDIADYICDGVDDEVQFNEAISTQIVPGKMPIELIGNFTVGTPILITKDTKFIINGIQTSDTSDGRGSRIKAKIGFIGNAVIQWNPIDGLNSELHMQGVEVDVIDMTELMELSQEEMMEFMTTGNIPLAIWSQVGRVVLRECEIIGCIDSFGLRDLYEHTHIIALNPLHPEYSALTLRGILPFVINCDISCEEGMGNSITIAEGCVTPVIFSSIISSGMDDPFDLGHYHGNIGVPDTVEEGSGETGASGDYWKELANHTFVDDDPVTPSMSTVIFNGMDSAFEGNPLPDLDKFKIDIMGEANVQLNTMTTFRAMINDDGQGNYNNGDYYGFVNGGDSDNPFNINMNQGILWYATIGQVEAASIAIAKIELIFEKLSATDEYYWVDIRIQGFNTTTGNKVDYEGFCVCKEPSEAHYINNIAFQAFNGTFHGSAKLSMWGEGTTQR